jgi:hypothetical protein
MKPKRAISLEEPSPANLVHIMLTPTIKSLLRVLDDLIKLGRSSDLCWVGITFLKFSSGQFFKNKLDQRTIAFPECIHPLPPHIFSLLLLVQLL